MLIVIIILALSLNVDALGVGLSYGMRNIKITFGAKLTLSLFAILYSGLGIWLGSYLIKWLPLFYAKLIGVIILVYMGLWIIFGHLFKVEDDRKVLRVGIKSLRLTIEIIKDPVACDIDKSNTISSREAIYLATALSIDTLGASVACGTIGLNSLLVPVMISVCQIIFISVGLLLGKRLSVRETDSNRYFIISGLLLIIIGLMRLI